MCSVKEKRELAILMRISRELDIVGDVSVTVDEPSELLAWSIVLKEPKLVAWRAQISGSRFVQVSANRAHAPIRGHITIVLPCKPQDDVWSALGLDDMRPGEQRELDQAALSTVWAELPTDAAQLVAEASA